MAELGSESETFEIWPLAEMEADAEVMVKYGMEDSAVAADVIPLAVLPRNPRTEETVEEEEEGPTATNSSPPYTTPPTTTTTLYLP